MKTEAIKTPETEKEPTIQEKIDSLKAQQEQAKEMFLKCQGGIEILESLK